MMGYSGNDDYSLYTIRVSTYFKIMGMIPINGRNIGLEPGQVAIFTCSYSQQEFNKVGMSDEI